MRKLTGLEFLQKHFPKMTVPCIFIRSAEDLSEAVLDEAASRIWRVRIGRKHGSELNTPYGSFANKLEVINFVVTCLNADDLAEAVIHAVDSQYFKPSLIGSLAVLLGDEARNLIELQSVDTCNVERLMRGNGPRPRDWTTIANIEYLGCSRRPYSLMGEAAPQVVADWSPQIEVLRALAEKLKKLRPNTEHVTRFNLYDTGHIILDDHRDATAFLG